MFSFEWRLVFTIIFGNINFEHRNHHYHHLNRRYADSGTIVADSAPDSPIVLLPAPSLHRHYWQESVAESAGNFVNSGTWGAARHRPRPIGGQEEEEPHLDAGANIGAATMRGVFRRLAAAEPGDWIQIGDPLLADAAQDEFGTSVSLSSDGHTLAVGAINSNDNGNDSGKAKVFSFDGTDWVQKGADLLGEDLSDTFGSSVSLSSDGNTLAVGGQGNDGNGSGSGHVRVFDFNGSAWVQRGIDIDGEAAGDRSGISVAISGDGNIIAIGADRNDNAAAVSNTGQVRVWEWSGTAWVQMGQDLEGVVANDNAGTAVSLSTDGQTVAVGIRGRDVTASGAGQVQIFDWSGTAWLQRGDDIDGEALGDFSGAAVSLSGDGNSVAIGAYLNDGSYGLNRGHVRVYVWSGTAWLQRGADIDGDSVGDQFGFSVAMNSDGTIFVAGADRDDDGGSNAGRVKVFCWNGSIWEPKGPFVDGEIGNDNFGNAVAISSDGETFAAGAYLNDDGAYNGGNVRVFTYGPYPTSQPSSQPSGIPTAQPSSPSGQPSGRPSAQPTSIPTTLPSSLPSLQPSTQPTAVPTRLPSVQPSSSPSAVPSVQPSAQPIAFPSSMPSTQPTTLPSAIPSAQPSEQPLSLPSACPSRQPSSDPSAQPTAQPSLQPVALPTSAPSTQPSAAPSVAPSGQPTSQPSGLPSAYPSTQPSSSPSTVPTSQPSSQPQGRPTSVPSGQPSSLPSAVPSTQPSTQPSDLPTALPSMQPSSFPSAIPSTQPTTQPSLAPSSTPSSQPTSQPNASPSVQPSGQPTSGPSQQPQSRPSASPSSTPSTQPSAQPVVLPTSLPSSQPSTVPSTVPSNQPSSQPSLQPSILPTGQPSAVPSTLPSSQPSIQPSSVPSCVPSSQPSSSPSSVPSTQPSGQPVSAPSAVPTAQPSSLPTAVPSTQPSTQPSGVPTCLPTGQPTTGPSAIPSVQPSTQPSMVPSSMPSGQPSSSPSTVPSSQPGTRLRRWLRTRHSRWTTRWLSRWYRAGNHTRLS